MKPNDSYVPKTGHYGVSLLKNWHNCTQTRLTNQRFPINMGHCLGLDLV